MLDLHISNRLTHPSLTYCQQNRYTFGKVTHCSLQSKTILLLSACMYCSYVLDRLRYFLYIPKHILKYIPRLMIFQDLSSSSLRKIIIVFPIFHSFLLGLVWVIMWLLDFPIIFIQLFAIHFSPRMTSQPPWNVISSRSPTHPVVGSRWWLYHITAVPFLGGMTRLALWQCLLRSHRYLVKALHA